MHVIEGCSLLSISLPFRSLGVALYFRSLALWLSLSLVCSSRSEQSAVTRMRTDLGRVGQLRVGRFRRVLVFEAHRLLYHSTLVLRAIKNKKRSVSRLARPMSPSDGTPRPCTLSPRMRYIYIYIYLLTQRERERERQR